MTASGAGPRPGLFWRLVEPAAEVTEVGERSRARLLAAVILVLVPTGLLSGLVQLATVPNFLPTFLAMLPALGLLFLAYLASRTRHFWVAGVFASVAPILGCLFAVIQNPNDRAWYGFMLLSVLLASVFLSTLGTIAIAVLDLVALGVAAWMVPEFALPSTLVPVTMLHLVFAPMVIIAARHRDRVERARQEELRRSLAQRQELHEQLLEGRRLETVGRLAGGIAHDFNNILSVIRAGADLIEQVGDASVHAEVGEIQEAADRGAGLTRQLLAYARRQILEPRVLDLGGLVERMVPMLIRVLGERVRIVVRAEQEIAVRADPSQLEQVLLNLAVNARDAMPSGGTLTIEARARPSDVEGERWAILSVSDTGAGMDEDTKGRIFEPFFTNKEKATGLGLATVHGIVTQSGGRIQVESTVGVGSRFEVLLPTTREAPEPVEQPAPTPITRTGRLTILLAEDEETLRQQLARSLTDDGFNVLAAPDGATALTLAKSSQGGVHLLITDLVMSEMTGLELADALLLDQPELPVLFMSGYAPDELGDLDGAPFLSKPFSRSQLLEKVHQLLATTGPTRRDEDGLRPLSFERTAGRGARGTILHRGRHWSHRGPSRGPT